MRQLVRLSKDAFVPPSTQSCPSYFTVIKATVPQVEHNVVLNRAFYDDALYEAQKLIDWQISALARTS